MFDNKHDKIFIVPTDIRSFQILNFLLPLFERYTDEELVAHVHKQIFERKKFGKKTNCLIRRYSILLCLTVILIIYFPNFDIANINY